MARMLGMAVVFSAIVACGCHGGDPTVLHTWASPDPPYVVQQGSSNAFDGYVAAASEAEQDAPVSLELTSFTPDKRDAAIKGTRRAMATLRRAASRRCEFQYRACRPFTPVPYRRGWRLLGHVLSWQIMNAVKVGDYSQAVSSAVLATKFGFDLTGGGPVDASLGYAIVDEARKAIAPAMSKMQSKDLAALGSGIERALAAKPPLSQMIENERKDMLLGVQTVQDACVSGQLDQLGDMLGSDSRDALVYLSETRSKGAEAQRNYFEGFAREADQEVSALLRVCNQPANARPKDLTPHDKKERRPWKRFTSHFFGAGEELLGVDDATLARTRLLALTAKLMVYAKTAGAVPRTLDSLPTGLTRDPYTGQPFAYDPQGVDFTLYSVGADYEDNGGETDDTFTTPDLKLERPGA